ncbi:hypothetical protein [Hyphococcus sp.]|jgi:hypothetical protein|uniref:hypothetical protein n=1 Tax=Hyphococcus sp. TaxID=2038636 RepID=UPI003D13030E
MSQSAVIQSDVASAFSVRSDRIFYRGNNQIYAIVGNNPEKGVVSDVWFDRFDDQADFRAVLNHIADLFEKGGYRYWLADLRFMTSDFMESEAWLVSDLMPRVIAAGLRREAVVLPDAAVKVEGADAFAAASRALQDIADGRVRGFTDIALAKAWLFDGALPE